MENHILCGIVISVKVVRLPGKEQKMFSSLQKKCPPRPKLKTKRYLWFAGISFKLDKNLSTTARSDLTWSKLSMPWSTDANSLQQMLFFGRAKSQEPKLHPEITYINLY